jgi:hypothetical protein
LLFAPTRIRNSGWRDHKTDFKIIVRSTRLPQWLSLIFDYKCPAERVSFFFARIIFGTSASADAVEKGFRESTDFQGTGDGRNDVEGDI